MARVLIMEDEPGIKMVLEMVLREEGHQVTAVEDGQRGLQALESGTPPDVVFVDLHMPIVDGQTVLERMQSSPLLRGIPAVLMTGDGASSPLLPPRSHYAAILSKPFDIWDVVQQARRLSAPKRATG
jgi:two-component system response regulator (stage 0 sporulation protein F)